MVLNNRKPFIKSFSYVSCFGYVVVFLFILDLIF